MIINEFSVIYLVSNIVQTYLITKCLRIFCKEVNPNAKKSLKICCVLYYLITSAVYLMFDEPITMMACNLFLLYIVAMNFRCSILQRILNVVLVYILFMIIESATVLLVNGIEAKNLTYEYKIILGLFVSKVITIVCVTIIDVCKRTRVNIIISSLNWISLLLFPIGTLFIFHAILANEKRHIWIFTSLFILLFFNLLIVYLYDIVGIKYLKEMENKLLEQQNLYYYKQIEVMENQNKEIKMLHHDYKNHLIALLGFTKKNDVMEIEDYIKELIENGININEHMIDTGNPSVDSLVNYKIFEALKLEVQLTVDISIPEKVKISQSDISSILGNLLDNAIEACDKLPVEERYLEIKIQFDRNMLFIMVCNSCKRIKIEEKKIITSKVDIINHGFGLQNVEKIVEKCNGYMEKECNERIFKINVILYGAEK